jgi:hypothetical protein
MTYPSQRPSFPSDDPTIEAEWRRLEAARLAAEREEAREDATEAPRQAPQDAARRRWLIPAFGLALVSGVVLAIVLNPRPPAPPPESERAVAVKQATELWAEANRIDAAALGDAGIRRVVSTAAVPVDQLLIRVAIRDQGGRDRLESLLAASGLRIESEPGRPDGGTAAIDSLVVSGRPTDVDALVDRLIASPTMLEVRSPALLAAVSSPTPPPGPDGGGLPPGPSTTETIPPPTRVRLLVEVIELPAGASDPAPLLDPAPLPSETSS